MKLLFTSRVSNFQRPFLFRKFSTADGVELAFAKYGDHEKNRKHNPLLICHGLFGQKTNWNSVAKAVQKRLDNVVYAVDLRNHGDSPHCSSMSYTEQATDLYLLIQKICAEGSFKKADLLGHSMGGKVAMRFAIDPHGSSLIDKLIIEDISPKGYSVSSHTFRYYVEAMRKADLSLSRQEISKGLEHDIPELAIRQFLLTNLRPRQDGTFEWKMNLTSIGRHFEDILGCSLPVGTFRGPTLFIYGDKSGYVPDEDRPLIRNLFPQVEFSSVKNAGHWVHSEQPQTFIDEICRFIEKK
ncbi:unnamed protein product, partial [Mesorhabditis belari]|uniref:sn-1-specific diacylglycerol lipase ABHD11 n=1 Tax=Mesorhabditis belari TaxID=2138241 RepID=A0AAF3F5S6_9BILA